MLSSLIVLFSVGMDNQERQSVTGNRHRTSGFVVRSVQRMCWMKNPFII